MKHIQDAADNRGVIFKCTSGTETEAETEGRMQ